MKRVLVSGGGGFIGSCVVELLVKNGYHPVVLDTFYWGKEAFDELPSGAFTLIEGDVRSSRDVAYALQGIDAGVIHLAGIVGAAACRKNLVAHLTVNVESTHTLVNCMTQADLNFVRDLIYCSSCSVYGNVCGMYNEVVETTPTMPLSEYAHGKLQAEKIILKKAQEVAQFAPTILRLTTIFGWSPRMRIDLVSNWYAYKAVKGEAISVHGGGGQYRSLIHVRDVASALVTALEAPRYLRRGQIFHVGEETNNITLLELAEKVRVIVPEATIDHSDDVSTDRRDYRINCQKFRNALGWKAQYSVTDGLVEMIDKLRASNADFNGPQYRNDRFDYV